MVAEGIKAFPKTGFYLYYPIVNRTELETGHRQGNSCEREEKERNIQWSIFLGKKRVESDLELNMTTKFST